MKTEMVPASPGWSGRMEGKREVGCWGECVQGVILGIEQGGPGGREGLKAVGREREWGIVWESKLRRV